MLWDTQVADDVLAKGRGDAANPNLAIEGDASARISGVAAGTGGGVAGLSLRVGDPAAGNRGADRDGEKPRLALRQRGPRDDGGVGEEVKRPPHGDGGDPGGRGDGLREETFLETEPHLAVNDPLEEVTLFRSGPGEEASEGLALPLP